MNVSNFNPNYLTSKELAHYGRDHNDPWVRRLAELAYNTTFYLDHRLGPLEKYNSDPDEYFENLEIKMSDLENEAANAVSDLESHMDEMRRLQNKVAALKMQLDDKELEYQSDLLRARIYEKSKELDSTKHLVDVWVGRHSSLEKKYNELHEKYNTFTIIATA
jgi:chromosome segregation ATPase